MGYFLIVLTVGVSLTQTTLQKIYSNRHGNGGFLFTAFLSLFSFLFLLGRYIITDDCKTDFTMELLPYALAGAFCYCVASVASYLAYQTGPYGITGLIFSFSILITSIFGIIMFDEPYTIWTFVGFGLIIVSLILVYPPKKNTKEQEKPEKNDTAEKAKEKTDKISVKWIIAVIVNLILSPAYGILTRFQQKKFNDTVTNEFIMIAIGLSAIILFVVGFATAKKGSKNIVKTSFPYASTAGVANGLTNILTAALYMLLPISIQAPTTSVMSKVASFFIAYYVFKERFILRQIIGIFVGVFAVVLINVATII